MTREHHMPTQELAQGGAREVCGLLNSGPTMTPFDGGSDSKSSGKQLTY